MARNADDWRVVLRKIDVAESEVARWAPVFATVIVDDTFSMGDEELDDFVANVAHESENFTRLEENLHYSTPERICKVFPSRVRTLAEAQPLVRNPRALAERVYGRRADLGNVTAEDGWLCRGSGLIQATGLKNLTALAGAMGWSDARVLADAMRLDEETALRASVVWWEGHVPDAFMSQPRRVRQAVNGPAALGADATERLTRLARQALQRSENV